MTKTIKAWHEHRDLAWAKLHAAWFDSPSHRHLKITTLGIGLAMMVLANQRGRAPDGSGWVVTPGGKSMSREDIARFAHASLNQTNSAIKELLEAETLTERGDGALGFVNLQKWQEDPAAERMRRLRAERAGLQVVGGSDVIDIAKKENES